MNECFFFYEVTVRKISKITPFLQYLWDFPAPHQYKEIFRNNIHYKLRESEPYYKKPEIYLWEKMYKLDFPTRPMDAKKKFYEGHVWVILENNNATPLLYLFVMILF